MNDSHNETAFRQLRDPHWIKRDARSSPFVRIVNGRLQRYNPSPELDKHEAIHGVSEGNGTMIHEERAIL